jgi:PAP2 superfamily
MHLLNQWNELLLEAIRVAKPGPPMAARSIAIVYTAAYDAWAAYDATAKPTRNDVAQRPAAESTIANKEIAVSYAVYRALFDQFPLSRPVFTAKMTELGLNPADLSVAVNTPVGVGNKASNAVLTFRQTDGSNESGGYADTSGYASANPTLNPLFASMPEHIPYPEKWQGLEYLTSDNRPASPKFIAPHWGSVTPFALASGSEFRPHAPQSILSQGFIDQAKYVVEVQANLTPTQKVIAEYWADGPKSELPPGHWALFTGYVVERDNMSLDNSVKLFFAVSNAIFDASIATWEAKRYYDYCRPITAIRHLFRGKTLKAWGGPGRGTVDVKGEMWRTFQVDTFPTPPFAEYTSGHSAFSMAAAEVLKRFTNSDRFGYYYMQQKPLAVDPTEDVTGIALMWNTFTQAAWEAGESRIYGGIHFYEGNAAGLELGQKVGAKAFLKAKQYWDGTI